MEKIAIWHNSRCSKSREALSILEEENCDKEVFEYLHIPLTKEIIKELLKKLSLTPRELMRTKEDVYKELNLKEELSDEKLIEAMVAHPKLIERPIIVQGDKAIIARPPSLVESFLKI
ncbi:MAG: arsenate reductase (glutaredoxin) [Sulfurimonadaceae bacterium]|jgi:arsenate reductase|nr:arsenate reductase (glutaredoxin) [Sulfurimonadaceae bacterium]